LDPVAGSLTIAQQAGCTREATAWRCCHVNPAVFRHPNLNLQLFEPTAIDLAAFLISAQLIRQLPVPHGELPANCPYPTLQEPN